MLRWKVLKIAEYEDFGEVSKIEIFNVWMMRSHLGIRTGRVVEVNVVESHATLDAVGWNDATCTETLRLSM